MLTLAGIIAFLLNGFFVNKSDVFDKNGGANIHTSIELSMLHPIGEKRLVDGNKEHLAEVSCVYSDVRGNVGLIILNANAFNDKRIKNITYPSRSKGNSVLISGKSVSISDGTQEYINKIDSGVLLALTGTNTPFDCGKYCLAASLDYKIENYTVKYTGLIVAGIGALWVILVTVRIKYKLLIV